MRKPDHLFYQSLILEPAHYACEYISEIIQPSLRNLGCREITTKYLPSQLVQL